jgi:hypothetical protein
MMHPDYLYYSRLVPYIIGFRIGSVPVRYFSEASSIDFKNSTVYGLKTLGALLFCYILWCHLAAQYSCLLLIRFNTLASLLLLIK